MALKLMYITNDCNVATIAENNGVDRIFLDLELIGKELRQGHLDTVISRHCMEDIAKIKAVLQQAELLVRTNPIHKHSKPEIDQIIQNGADIVMLPFFKSADEVREFIRIVNKRAKVCLLFETPEAVNNIDEILALDGIDEAHIGLNDLHLGYKLTFMFELLTNGVVEAVCKKFSQKNIPYGFGGIAHLNKGLLPANYIIAEHYRLGSQMAILSRSFYDSKTAAETEEINTIFYTGIQEIRMYEDFLLKQDEAFFTQNHIVMKKIIDKIVYDLENR